MTQSDRFRDDAVAIFEPAIWRGRLGSNRQWWENGYNEPFNGKLRVELLNAEICYTLKEAKVLI